MKYLKQFTKLINCNFCFKRYLELQVLNPLLCQETIAKNEENFSIKNHILFPQTLIFESNALASNIPIEDRLAVGKCTHTNDVFAAVFDGHLGSSMSHLLSQRFLNYLALTFLPNQKLKEILSILKEYQITDSMKHDQEMVLKYALLNNLKLINKPINYEAKPENIVLDNSIPHIPWHYYIKYIEHLIAQNEARQNLLQRFKDSKIKKESPGVMLSSEEIIMLQNKETFIIQRLEQAFVYYDEHVLKLAAQEIDELSILYEKQMVSLDYLSSDLQQKLGEKKHLQGQDINSLNHENLVPSLNKLSGGTSRKISRRVQQRSSFKLMDKIKEKLSSPRGSMRNYRTNFAPPPWVKCALSGSTACVAFINYPSSQEEVDKTENNVEDEPAVLYVANVGDSRAVLGSIGPNGEWVTTKLSYKHYAENTWEVRRIQSEHPKDFEKPWLLKGGRLLGFLMPTRSFGDAMLKWPVELTLKARKLFSSLNIFVPTHYASPPYLTAKPEVISHVLRPEDKFMIIATDGLWDFLHTRQVVKILGDRWNRLKTKSEVDGNDEGYETTSSIAEEGSQNDSLEPIASMDFRPSSHEDLTSSVASSQNQSNSKISKTFTKDETSKLKTSSNNAVAENILSQQSQFKPRNEEEDLSGAASYYYTPNESTCNSATLLIENSLGGYGTITYDSSPPNTNNSSKQHVKNVSHPGLNIMDGGVGAPLTTKSNNFKRDQPVLDYLKLSTLLNLPEEIRRDFRDDITVIVLYFDV